MYLDDELQEQLRFVRFAKLVIDEVEESMDEFYEVLSSDHKEEVVTATFNVTLRTGEFNSMTAMYKYLLRDNMESWVFKALDEAFDGIANSLERFWEEIPQLLSDITEELADEAFDQMLEEKGLTIEDKEINQEVSLVFDEESQEVVNMLEHVFEVSLDDINLDDFMI